MEAGRGNTRSGSGMWKQEMKAVSRRIKRKREVEGGKGNGKGKSGEKREVGSGQEGGI